MAVRPARNSGDAVVPKVPCGRTLPVQDVHTKPVYIGEDLWNRAGET